MKIKTLAMFLGLMSLSGCATIFGAKSDKITIHSKYPDAVFTINGNEIGRGNVVYDLERGKTVIITASKKGCSDVSMPTGEKLNNTTFVNLIFWPGYLIDAASGSIHEVSSTDYTVNPNCNKH
jgi:hypothetical protein